MKKIILYLLIFFSAAIFISQSLMDLAATLLGLSVLIYGFQQKPRFEVFKKTGFEKIFLFWVIFVGIGLVYNEAPFFKKIFEFKWIFNFYFVVSALRLFEISEKYIRGFTWFILISTIYAVSVYFLKFDILRPQSTDFSQMAGGVRVGGFYSDYMTYAHGFGMLFCVYFGMCLQQLKKYLKIDPLMLATTVLLALALLLTFTRGVWIGLGVAVLVMAYLVRVRWGHVLLITGITFVSVLYLSWGGFRDRVNFAFQYQQNHDSERIVLWKTNFHIFKKSPVIGIGYGENKRLLRQYFDELGVPEGQFEGHAHNQFIHFLAGTGIIGLLAYLYFMYLFLKKLSLKKVLEKSHRLSGMTLGVFGAVICFLVGGLTESNFEHSKLKYILVSILALGIYIREKVLAEEK